MKKMMAGVTFVVLLAAGSARAAEGACQADIDKLCQGVQPGEGRILACLKTNKAQVSKPCQAKLASVAHAAKEVSKRCEDDVLTFCSTVKPGKGAVLKCLGQNEARLQPQCQEVVAGAKERGAEFKKNCGADAKKLCAGIPQGQGQILSCLMSKKADLSPKCQAMFP
jgi:Golgi apparatus protein 1